MGLGVAGLVVTGIVLVGAGSAGWREATLVASGRLEARSPETPGTPATVSFEGFESLPEPVARYLRFALTEGQPFYRRVRVEQSGKLRSAASADARYRPFDAVEVLSLAPAGFVWDAQMALHSWLPKSLNVRVRDAFIDGKGAAQVRLLSVVPMGEEAGDPELNSGALMRYLAEAVWLPTALHPAAGVQWTEMDEHHALATLASGDTEVSLEFEFLASGAISAIYSPGRYLRRDGGYGLEPWRGRHEQYQRRSEMRVPTWGEVAWELEEGPVTVWRGRLERIEYFVQ